MSSLNQYLELYSQNREAIDCGSSSVLNKHRQQAYEALLDARLPRKGEEGYERTSVEDMMAPDYGVNINRVAIPADVAASFRCDVPNMSTLLGVVVNDEFHGVRGLEERLPKGVVFGSLRKIADKHPELVEKYYGALTSFADSMAALNTMLAQDGVMIYVPKGVKMERPMQLVNIFSSPTPLMAARRVLVVVEDEAEAQLLVCDHTQDTTQSYLSSEVVEIHLGENAKFDYYHIEESSPLTTRHSQLFSKQGSGSSLLVNGMTLTCGSTRNNYMLDIAGSHCETLLSGMAIGSGKMHIDNNVQLCHLSGHCYSNQLFKYVLDDESTGVFGGRILVAEEADFTDAYQTNRNMLASAKARMHTKPQLEIYNDDVKCSHGATTGQLDTEALFYMRTRGIPEVEARNMLMQAFMADVIDTVRMEGLRDRLRHMVEKRFQGADGMCGDCSVSCHETMSDKL